MMLGALVAVGLDADWLRALPETLGLGGVRVRVQEVLRGEIVCWKVHLDIPPQPHGRGIREIAELLRASGKIPDRVLARADQVFHLIADREAEIHGTRPEDVHLHEVGAVDAILDVVGSVWGLELLGVERVYCGPIQLGDGFVKAAHGTLPVPAPATLRLLEGLRVRPGPEGAGELVTPTGAALVRALSTGLPPAEYVPRRSGFGAGTKDFVGRANALRIVLADVDLARSGPSERATIVACDVDDMSPEYVAGAAERARVAGALDVTLVAVTMKKGRQGTRIEILCRPEDAPRFEALLLRETTTIGVRRSEVDRVVLAREEATVDVLGHTVRVKVVTLSDGGRRAKPEFDDVQRVALATNRSAADIYQLALAAERR